MKVLVCGGRDYADVGMVYDTLDTIDAKHGITRIIEGGAKGADHHAAQWAILHHCPRSTFAARWDLDGKAAGPIRNARMLREGAPDLVVAFDGGRGTADMVSRAKKAGIEVLEIHSSTPHEGAPS